MKKLTLVLLLFSILGTFAQSITKEELEKKIIPLNEKISILQSENNKLKSDISKINSKVSNAFTNIDNLQKQSNANSNLILQTKSNLISEIKTSETNSKEKISAVDMSLSNNSLYGIFAVVLIIILSTLFFWLISKRQKIDKLNLVDQLNNTKSSIEESLVKEFGKQTELMETQLHLIEQQKTIIQSIPNIEPDHSLALKVASEINLIERNVNLMDTKTKGLKQLLASVGKLKDNLSANGYEMPYLLGKPYNQGLRVIVATSITDENLEKGSEIITKILIPQVNYKDKMIQTAQIEVSVGY